ncbi:GMP/IMP nucleotidase [Flagellatimonas centrodinii]|uniref:GMP/IMP nucleotidase n=1 Tax=Flagellatimonas centrodinii TaxID=2806210 RepID=UPI0023BAEA98|nr:GMP/IMP nucleotidase [Flagellatimonas centrodinii]
MEGGGSVGDARIDWSRVDLVILDMDGTVLDLAYDNYFWQTFLPQRYAALHGLDEGGARARLEPLFTSTAHTLPWYCTDFWSAQTGLDMASLKHEIRHRIAPLPGAEDFLHRVRHSGRGLWLATNAHRDSWQLKLRHTGLRDHFDTVVCSHDFGAPKEDQDFWQRFRQAHPFDPERALFVDDSRPVLDAARLFGIGQVVAIRHPDRSTAPRPVPGHASIDALAALNPPD